ncbi:hypothetical protein TruAng_008250 [Truncatella angustata]|nr:hypothetical protein TruAng_008250 [Truncatella angustata]
MTSASTDAAKMTGNFKPAGDAAPIINSEQDDNSLSDDVHTRALERRLRLKVDLRLCTIAGILCSLNLLDSGVISSASVTSMISDLDLSGNRYSVAIFIFTIASIAFQLPSTIAVRTFGPRIWFASITFAMIALRVLLGMTMSGIYPGLTYLISTWYPRREQQTSIVNFGLNQLDGRGGIAGWRYMFLVQGIISMVIGVVTYFWIVDFPEQAHKSIWFLTEEEQRLAVSRIHKDRKDVDIDPFSWGKVLVHAKDPKVYGFACMFFFTSRAALSTYQANNITGQWKRVFTAATVTAMNGAGGIAGSFIVRNQEAPRYLTAVWVSIGSHILIIALVAAFSAYFYYANKAEKSGKKILEEVEGFRYTY